MKWIFTGLLLAASSWGQPTTTSTTNFVPIGPGVFSRVVNLTIVDVVSNRVSVPARGTQSPQFTANFPRIAKNVSRISERTAMAAGLPMPPELDGGWLARAKGLPRAKPVSAQALPSPKALLNGKVVRLPDRGFRPAGVGTDYEPMLSMADCCATVSIHTDGVGTYGIDYSLDLRTWQQLVMFDPGTHPAGTWGYGYIRDDATYPNIFFRSWRY